MALYLLIFSAIVVICIFFNKFSGKFGIPVLLLFLVLGLLCGSLWFLSSMPSQASCR